MKFMLMRKADGETEQGILPTDELFKAMLDYNDRMIQAGVFLFGNGLRPTSEGCRIVFRNGQPEVLRGPFTSPGEQLAGYSVLEVDSLEQAIEWARQWPTLDSNGNAVLELRRYFEPRDFAPGPLVEAHCSRWPPRPRCGCVRARFCSAMAPSPKPRSSWPASTCWRPGIWTRPCSWPAAFLPHAWAASRCVRCGSCHRRTDCPLPITGVRHELYRRLCSSSAHQQQGCLYPPCPAGRGDIQGARRPAHHRMLGRRCTGRKTHLLPRRSSWNRRKPWCSPGSSGPPARCATSACRR